MNRGEKVGKARGIPIQLEKPKHLLYSPSPKKFDNP